MSCKFDCHDSEGNLLLDIWEGRDPPNVGKLWLNYFYDHMVNKNE